jgi:ABC-type uncharacterized transport system permease subunit
MMLYTLFSTAISLAVANENIHKLSSLIHSGQIVTNLIRPIGLFRSILFETLGKKALAIVVEVAPILLLGYLQFDVPLPHWHSVLLFSPAFATGFLVTASLTGGYFNDSTEY